MSLLKEDMKMRYDFSPLYRSTIGFDRLFSMLDQAAAPDSGNTYPPYDIGRTGEDAYRITLAVAGFSEAELSIEQRENLLSIRGSKETRDEKNEASEVLYRGIAARSFERRFQLASHVQVTGAKLENGLLHVALVREIPEASKPRRITIGDSKIGDGKVLDGQTQAAELKHAA